MEGSSWNDGSMLNAASGASRRRAMEVQQSKDAVRTTKVLQRTTRDQFRKERL
jgi:hypothetical protein